MTDYRLEQMYSQSQVRTRTRELAYEIYPELAGFESTVVILTLGGIRFGGDIFDDLADFDDLEPLLLLEAMGVTSYGDTGPIEEPRIFQKLKEPKISITDRKVLVADDIRHTGNTLSHTVIPYIESFGPRALSVVTLLSAEDLPPLDISGKTYAGFYMNKKKYVVGTFLDKNGRHRGVKGIQEVIFER